MPTLTMLKGLPASGKSTWAKEQAATGHGKVKRINKDDLRAMIDSSKHSKTNERQIIHVRNKLADFYLGDGCDVIIDDTNFAPQHEETLRKIAVTRKAEFVVKEFYIPVTVAEERDAKRVNSVGPEVIRRMWLQSVCKSYVVRPDLPRAIICDIDGTIAHMTNRGPYDETRVGEDKSDPTVALAVATLALNTSAEIILVSGRHNSCRKDTIAWLEKNHIGYQQLFMRAENDNRKDYIIKQEIFEDINDQYNILAAFDDRQQVCDMWREKGILVFQVADGRF